MDGGEGVRVLVASERGGETTEAPRLAAASRTQNAPSAASSKSTTHRSASPPNRQLEKRSYEGTEWIERNVLRSQVRPRHEFLARSVRAGKDRKPQVFEPLRQETIHSHQLLKDDSQRRQL